MHYDARFTTPASQRVKLEAKVAASVRDAPSKSAQKSPVANPKAAAKSAPTQAAPTQAATKKSTTRSPDKIEGIEKTEDTTLQDLDVNELDNFGDVMKAAIDNAP